MTDPSERRYRCLYCGQRWKGVPSIEVFINGQMTQPTCPACAYLMVVER